MSNRDSDPDSARSDATGVAKFVPITRWASRLLAVLAIVTSLWGPDLVASIVTTTFLFVVVGAAPSMQIWSRSPLGSMSMLPGLVLVVSTSLSAVVAQLLIWGPGLSAVPLVCLAAVSGEVWIALLRRERTSASTLEIAA